MRKGNLHKQILVNEVLLSGNRDSHETYCRKYKFLIKSLGLEIKTFSGLEEISLSPSLCMALKWPP